MNGWSLCVPFVSCPLHFKCSLSEGPDASSLNVLVVLEHAHSQLRINIELDMREVSCRYCLRDGLRATPCHVHSIVVLDRHARLALFGFALVLEAACYRRLSHCAFAAVTLLTRALSHEGACAVDSLHAQLTCCKNNDAVDTRLTCLQLVHFVLFSFLALIAASTTMIVDRGLRDSEYVNAMLLLKQHTRAPFKLSTNQICLQRQQPCALTKLKQVLASFEHKRVLVFLDYDGTLTPIVSNPDEAFMSQTMRDVVKRVAETFPTAIISGRSRSKVEDFVQLPELFYAGSHGLDIKGPVVRLYSISTSKLLDCLVYLRWLRALLFRSIRKASVGVQKHPGRGLRYFLCCACHSSHNALTLILVTIPRVPTTMCSRPSYTRSRLLRILNP